MDAAASSPAGPGWWCQAICHSRTSLMLGGSVVRAQETHGYGSAIMALLTYYLPLRSSARTRRRAACITPPRGDCPRFSCQRRKQCKHSAPPPCGTVPGFSSLATLSRGDCPWFLAFCPNGAQGDSPGQRPVGSNVEITSPRGDCPRFLATVGKTPVTVRRIDDLIARGQSSGFLPFAPTGRKVIAQGNALWVRTSK